MGKATVGGKVGKNIAHKGSNHVAIGTPATSTIPPPPPAGPAMAPFPHTCKSSKSKNPKTKLKTSGKKTVCDGCSAPVEMPGNQPSQPAVPPHDVMTLKVNSTGTNTTGSGKVKAQKKGVAATMDGKAMNTTTEGATMAQSNGVYTDAVDGGSYNDEWAELSAELLKLGDPVSVATGEVVDDRVDIELPGILPFFFSRIYISSFHREATPFGRGGWTHNWHQSIELDAHPEKGERLVLRDDDGRNVGFAVPARLASSFHRGKRLRLTSFGDGVYEVKSLASHDTRKFAPSGPGGRSLLRSVEDAYGNRIELVYDRDRLVQIIDTAGREIALTHDTKGRILLLEVRVAGAVLQTVAYSYDAEGDLVAATNALDHSERYAYDAHHRMTEKTLGDGVRVHYVYDLTNGRCRKTWVDGGTHAVEFIYDLAARTTTTTGTLEPRVYTWNKQGAIVKEATFDGDFVRERVYDDDLYVLTEKNAAGDEITFEYDALGNLVKEVDAAGNETIHTYEEERHTATIDPLGRKIAFGYDLRGDLQAIILGTGARYDLAYDGKGRLTNAFTSDGVLFRCEYDDAHNLISRADAHGATWRRAYDALGRVVSETDPLGATTRFEYDALGQPVRFTFHDGSYVEAAYDRRGNLVRYTDPLGQTTTMEFANVRSLVKLTDPLGRAWEFFYDKHGRIKVIKNPRAETFEYRYDRVGRVIEETSFDGRTLKYRYSKAGLPSRVDHPDGTWQELEYDALGNLVAEVSPHGAITFERDAIGQLLRATVEDATGPVVFERARDEHGRVIAETQNGDTIRYEYDAFGRRAARVLPDGRTTRYFYDANGKLTALDHDGRKLLLQRDKLGREVRRYAYRGEIDVQSAFDAMGRLTDRWTTKAVPGREPAMLTRTHWAYDALDRITNILDQRWGATRFMHDPIGMLTEAHRGAYRDTFSYDAADSLESALRERPNQAASGERPFRIRPGNVLVGDGDHTYEYDDNRRRKRRVGVGARSNEITEYFWDAHDRLREVALPDGGRVLFAYDAIGRRVRKEVYPPAPMVDIPAPAGLDALAVRKPSAAAPTPSRVVTYLWDGYSLALERDETVDGEESGATRAYLIDHRSLAPLLHQEQGSVFVYVNDHHETPKELIGEDGRVAWSAAHAAFGEVVEVYRDPAAKWEKPVDTPVRLLGQIADEETGLTCTLFRYFDPAVGRWLSSDPIRLGGGFNLFGFNGSPLLDIDPYGLSLEPNSVEEHDVGTMKQLERAARKDDGLDNHEILNSSWLKNNWSKYDSRYGANGGQNPAIAADHDTVHADIYEMQHNAEMTGKKAKGTFAKQTARQNMHLNAQFLYKALRKNGMSAADAKKKVEEIYKKTLDFIKKNNLTC